MTGSRETEEELVAPIEAASRADRIAQIVVPVVMLALVILAWHLYVTIYQVPHYILPGPLLVAEALYNDWPLLLRALHVTLEITLSALALALIGGVSIAILMAQSRIAELALYPYAVILQVTPIVAIAPLIIIYAPTTHAALLIIAFLVAFFPVLSNTVQGLKSTDHNLLNLFELYGASPLQTLLHLKIPSALPYFLVGLRIAGGLALIAAVVAEFVAGNAGADSGLAFRLLESQFRLNIPRLYAALLLLSATGVVIFFLTSLISRLLLRHWHESAVRREN
jgi:NitT/TauT family transport system permease protein